MTLTLERNVQPKLAGRKSYWLFVLPTLMFQLLTMAGFAVPVDSTLATTGSLNRSTATQSFCTITLTSGNSAQALCVAASIIPITYLIDPSANVNVAGLPTGITGSLSG